MRIGVDLGGTKIEAIALADDGRELMRQRIDTPVANYDATIAAIVRLIAAIESVTGDAGTVGVGIPGTISHATGTVKNANATWLIGRPLDKDLEQALTRPVRVANDANCFAVSEAIDGAARGANVVFGVILGTGVGGGLVVNGRVIGGINGIAGEWGHNPLPWPEDDERPGPPCYCGRYGCIETFLSGPGLSNAHAREFAQILPANVLAVGAERGDADARHSLSRYQHRLARGLATIINVIDPEVIVLGGGLSNIKSLYADVPNLWAPFVFSDRIATALRQNRHGDSSGVRGAAWLWPPTERDGSQNGH